MPGRNEDLPDLRVRRHFVHAALLWKQENDPAFSRITICKDRLQMLPIDGNLDQVIECELDERSSTENYLGPAPEQVRDSVSTPVLSYNTDETAVRDSVGAPVLSYKTEETAGRDSVSAPVFN